MGYNETLPPDLAAAIEDWSTYYWVQFDPDCNGFTPTFTAAELKKLLDYVN